jgi:hypothetical protein
MRRTHARAAMDLFREWIFDQQGRHPPKSPMGEAVRYALNQWNTLTAFLDDVRIPVDNNASERALRVVALGRKNFLFVGDEECGANLAGLYSLVATGDTVGVDLVEYFEGRAPACRCASGRARRRAAAAQMVATDSYRDRVISCAAQHRSRYSRPIEEISPRGRADGETRANEAPREETCAREKRLQKRVAFYRRTAPASLTLIGLPKMSEDLVEVFGEGRVSVPARLVLAPVLPPSLRELAHLVERDLPLMTHEPDFPGRCNATDGTRAKRKPMGRPGRLLGDTVQGVQRCTRAE